MKLKTLQAIVDDSGMKGGISETHINDIQVDDLKGVSNEKAQDQINSNPAKINKKIWEIEETIPRNNIY